MRKLFLQHIGQTSPSPLGLEITHGDGIYLYDTSGKKYIDLISGIGVSCLGHSHPAVVEAVKTQADQYMHTMVYGEYVLSPQVELAKRMTDHLPDTLNTVYFVNSGSEATEGAMKLARRYTGRPEIVACRYAYHGSTQGAASLMAPTDFSQAYYPLLPGIRHINFNDESSLQYITKNTAGVIIETVQAEWGVRKPENDFLKKLRKKCNETGALLVFDEIQAGYGRTGTLWAFEQYDVVPDILLLAKGMGGGMPIGAFVAANEIMQVLTHNPVLGHITTFGGHPVCCAAALATLRTLLTEEWIDQVKTKEQLFVKTLQHSAIKEVRSAGLLIAVELESFEKVSKVIEHCLHNGVITDWFLFNDRSLRIAPPLTISAEEIKVACDIILTGL